MQRTGLFDRDVCLKLSCCGLWNETLAALRITQAFRLASCTGDPSNRKILQRKIGVGPLLEEAMTRLTSMVAATPVIPDEAVAGVRSAGILNDLADIQDIDAGEALLTAIVSVANDPTILISGDKRFFKALREQRPLIWANVADRLLSFERCILSVAQSHGCSYVIERVTPVRACDGTLGIALGTASVCDEVSFLAALKSYDPGL